jgi:hypothetical protein
MADPILPHIDSYSYQIPLKNLEDVHFKVKQSAAVLSVLADWVCESGHSSLGYECKENLMQISFLLIDLMRDVEKLLPEV